MEAVGHGCALAQELRVRDHGDIGAPDGPLDQVHGPHWHRRLVDHNGAGLKERPDLCGRRLDIGQISRTVIALRGGHAEEDELAALNGLSRRGHVPKATGSTTLGQKHIETGLEDRHLAGQQHVQSTLVALSEDDVVSSGRKHPGCRKPHVSRANHADATCLGCWLRRLGLLRRHDPPSEVSAATSRATPSCHSGSGTPSISARRCETNGE